MIFQEPMTSLNPSYTIGNQIVEAIRRHQGLNAAEARARAIEMLRLVRIPSPEKRIDDYPHKLSGGMRQRAMIAMALACGPQLLIADEPTTALDVTIQAQILDLMRGLRRDTGTAIILITHDLGVVAEMADDVAVMYAGQIVERAPVEALFARPEHPYTVGLLGSIPKLDQKRERLPSIEGRVPDMAASARRLPLRRALSRSSSRPAARRCRRWSKSRPAISRAAAARRSAGCCHDRWERATPVALMCLDHQRRHWSAALPP